MKNHWSLLILIFCMALYGCSVEKFSPAEDSTGPSTVHFFVTADNVNTRAVYDEADGLIQWENMDALSIFEDTGDAESKAASKIYFRTDLGIAGFHGDVHVSDGDDIGFDFIYPYSTTISKDGGAYRMTLPSRQHMESSSFDEESLFLFASAENVSIGPNTDSISVAVSFNHVLGYMKLSFEDVPEGFEDLYETGVVDKVTVRAQDGSILAGDFLLHPADMVLENIGNNTSVIEVDGNVNIPIKDYVCYITVNPGVYENVEVTVSTVNGNVSYLCQHLEVKTGCVTSADIEFSGSGSGSDAYIEVDNASGTSFNVIGETKTFDVNANIPWTVSISTDLQGKIPTVTKLDDKSFCITMIRSSHFVPSGMTYTVTVEPEDKAEYPDETLVQRFTVNQGMIGTPETASATVTFNGTGKGEARIQCNGNKSRIAFMDVDELYGVGTYSLGISSINEGIDAPAMFEIRAYNAVRKGDARGFDFCFQFGDARATQISIAAVNWTPSPALGGNIVLADASLEGTIDEKMKDAKEVLLVLKSIKEGENAGKLRMKGMLVMNDDTILTLVDGMINDPWQYEGGVNRNSELYMGFNNPGKLTGDITIDYFQYYPDWTDPRSGM